MERSDGPSGRPVGMRVSLFYLALWRISIDEDAFIHLRSILLQLYILFTMRLTDAYPKQHSYSIRIEKVEQ